MNNINEFLIAGRKLAELWYKAGEIELGLQAIQLTSLVAIPHLPKPHRVICHCRRWLRNGKEVEFYNHTGSCYSCDSAYVDTL